MPEENDNSEVVEQPEKLKMVYDGLSKKNPQLSEIGYESFKTDMQDDAKLESLYNGLSAKNPSLKDLGFDGFKADMVPPVVNEAEEPTPPAPEGEPTLQWDQDGQPITPLAEQQSTTAPSGPIVESDPNELTNWESNKNSLKNMHTSWRKVMPSAALVFAETAEGIMGDELAKKAYELMGVDIEARKKYAIEAMNYLDEKMLPTKGIVESAKKGDIAGVASAIFNATTAVIGVGAPALATGGVTMGTEMIGASIKDFNKAKADNLGITEEELYSQNKEDFAVPATIGGLGLALEAAGMKGIGRAINRKIQGPLLNKATKLFADFQKEGATEWIQSALEAYNKSLGGGKSQVEAVDSAVNMMFSEEGLETYAQGVAGAAGATIGGRAIKSQLQKSDIEQLQKSDPKDDASIDAKIREEVANGTIVEEDMGRVKDEAIKDIEAAKKMEGGKIPEGKEGEVHKIIKEKIKIQELQKGADNTVAETLNEDLKKLDDKLRETLGLEVEKEEAKAPKPAEKETPPSKESLPTEISEADQVEVFSTKSGNQTVEFSEGELKILNKDGSIPSAPTIRKAKREYAAQYDFTQGEQVTEVDEKQDVNIADQQIIEKTTSPIDLIDVYQRQAESAEQAEQALDGSKEDVMDELLTGSVRRKSFEENADKNLIGRNLALAYFNKDGRPLDIIAMDATEISGVEVTEEDLIAHMLQYQKKGQYKSELKKNPIAQEAKDKFRQLTGLEINEETSRLARDQQSKKILSERKLNEQLLDEYYEKEYEEKEQFVEDFRRSIAEERATDKGAEVKTDESSTEGEPKETEKSVEGAIGKTGDNIDDWLRESERKSPKQSGFSIGLPSFLKSKDEITIPEDASLKSENKEVEKRWQASKGIKKDAVQGRVKEALSTLYKSFTRARPELDPKNVTDARTADVLRQFDGSSEYAKAMANEALKGITAGLGPKQYDVFSRNIILPDLIKDIKKDMFVGEDGKSKNLPFGYKDLAEVEADLDKFNKLMEANPSIKKAHDVRQAFMSTLKNNLVKEDLLNESVLEDDSYFHHQVLQHMQDPINFAPGTGGGLHKGKSGWQKARTGSSKDYNTDYLESEFEVISQAISQLEAKETIRKIREIADISKDLAKVAKEKGVKVADIIPEGYVEWNPDKSNLLYKGNTISDKTIERVLEQGEMLQEEDIKEALMTGKRPQWIIPENIATELDNLQKYPDEGQLGAISRNLLSTWKQWTLLNPFRVVKYNLNNTTGDLDIAMAYNPKILKYVKSSYQELRSHMKGGAMTQEMREATKKGVIGSGISIAEIPDISEEGILQFLKPQDNKAMNIISNVYKKSKDWTNLRENILRLAAYKHFKVEFAKGKTNLYAASRKSEIDAIEDNDDKAAKLARELIGDYGNVSKSGQWIRAKMMPFYSWMEVNTPRYVRLFKNIKHEGESEGTAGRIAKVGAGKLAWKGTKLAAKAAGLMAAVQLWNRTFFPDEDDELKLENKKQQHLILGRDEDGEIRSIRFQGALSDALSWASLDTPIQDYKDIMSGDKTVKEKLTEAAQAAPVKLLHSLRPEPKLLYETLTKQSLYPDPFNPKPIRDIGEHLARVVSADKIYKWIAGKPSKGITSDLASLLVYTSDPGEVAYYGMKSKLYDWIEETRGGDSSGFTPSKRSNALYYYKQALKYGDDKAAKKYYDQYIELGGDDKKMRKSIERSSPLGGLTRREMDQFKATLDKEDKNALKVAQKWYAKTYRTKKR